MKKKHISITTAGHLDSGKSTIVGRLLYELGVLDERSKKKLEKLAAEMGCGSYTFAFYLDHHKYERERQVSIAVRRKEFFTKSWHYTVIDVPGMRQYIRNMIIGASQADILLLVVPADNFWASIAPYSHIHQTYPGATRQHAELAYLLGIKQIIVGINKMDSDAAGYQEATYLEIKKEMIELLIRMGWDKEFVQKRIPFLPISGWCGDNLTTKSSNMPWWNGTEIEVEKGRRTIITLLDALEEIPSPKRELNKPMRFPISGVDKIIGIGHIVTGRVEQGTLEPGQEVLFLPNHDTEGQPCSGTIASIEMHYNALPKANAGDLVGIRIDGLNPRCMPSVGNVMVLKKDTSIKIVKTFTCIVQVINHPGKLKVGYSPIAYAHTAHATVRLEKIIWKQSKQTLNKKVPNPSYIKANEKGEVIFHPVQPLMVDTFKNCEFLGRVAFMEGTLLVILGKVIGVEIQ